MTARAGLLATRPIASRWIRGRDTRLTAIGAGVVVAMSLLALLGPELTRRTLLDGPPFEPPSFMHPLGTDDLGQDLLGQLFLGGRTSLAVALAAAVVATAMGACLGLFAGLGGGRTDQALARGFDIVLALPFLPLVIVVGAFLGQGPVGVALIIGVAWSAHTARIVRSQALEARSRPHVEHIIAMGASMSWVARRHLLPIVTPLLVPQFVRAAGAALIAEASITFLGLGDPTVPSWGSTIAFGQARGALFTGAWLWWIVPPGACIALVVSALAVLGFGLEEGSQPRIRSWGTVGPRAPRPARTQPVGPGGALLVATGLRVGYATGSDRRGQLEVVRSVDLAVRAGEVLGIVGASGSGKSTLAMGLVGLGGGRVLGGMVRFEGRDLASLRADELSALRGARIGVVPQDAMQGLDPVQPVDRQVAEVVRAHRAADRAEALRLAHEVLRRVGIDPDRAGAYPHQLSGGMRQRVVIAMALVNDPVLLIADEPTTGLDVVTQRDIVDLLAGLRHERGLTMVVVSHDLPTIARLADRVLVMADGREVAS
jgi:peptide/nickel transport system permease protein